MVWLAIAAILCGTRAEGLRMRASGIYAKLETAQARFQPDTAAFGDALEPPLGAVSWDLLRDGGARPVGTESLVLCWKRADGSILSRRVVRLRVRRVELVPVATRRLVAHKPLATGDVRWQWRETFGNQPPPPDSVESTRMTLRGGAGPEDVLLSNRWERPAAVEPGQKVSLRAGRAGASVSTEGTAQDIGRIGETFHVRSPFGKIILCRLGSDLSATPVE